MRLRQGQTLIEVIVATMVAAMAATAMFSVTLSSSVSGGRSDRREVGSALIHSAQEQLKVFVSADPNSSFSPNVGGKWAKDASNAWALQSGVTHDLGSLLAGLAIYQGRNPSFTYTVQNEDCGFGTGEFNSCKRVTFRLSYDD
jgi:type II secretory pathway pseudopilin PulG